MRNLSFEEAVMLIKTERERQRQLAHGGDTDAFDRTSSLNDFIAYTMAYLGRAVQRSLRNEREEQSFETNVIKALGILFASMERGGAVSFGGIVAMIEKEIEATASFIPADFDNHMTANDFLALAMSYLGRAAEKVARNEREGHTYGTNVIKAMGLLFAALSNQDTALIYNRA
tara:strand:- start:5473 stop:5991 length:519 start_codon:yes stop_codon:yes gene_type:complete